MLLHLTYQSSLLVSTKRRQALTLKLTTFILSKFQYTQMTLPKVTGDGFTSGTEPVLCH
jgi:hypothetical protein